MQPRGLQHINEYDLLLEFCTLIKMPSYSLLITCVAITTPSKKILNSYVEVTVGVLAALITDFHKGNSRNLFGE